MTPLDDTGESSSCSVTARQKPTVDFTQDGTLGILTLDNPPLNLIGAELISDLRDAIGEVETAREVRALLVRGNGKVFSAGADVALFAGKSADEMRPLINSFLDIVPLAGGVERLAAVGLFDTTDARNGIRTFLESGAGPATFSGR